MKKNLIILLILGSILFYLIYESYQFKMDSSDNEKINKDIKYYDNNIHIGKVLSDKLQDDTFNKIWNQSTQLELPDIDWPSLAYDSGETIATFLPLFTCFIITSSLIQ